MSSGGFVFGGVLHRSTMLIGVGHTARRMSPVPIRACRPRQSERVADQSVSPAPTRSCRRSECVARTDQIVSPTRACRPYRLVPVLRADQSVSPNRSCRERNARTFQKTSSWTCVFSFLFFSVVPLPQRFIYPSHPLIAHHPLHNPNKEISHQKHNQYPQRNSSQPSLNQT